VYCGVCDSEWTVEYCNQQAEIESLKTENANLVKSNGDLSAVFISDQEYIGKLNIEIASLREQLIQVGELGKGCCDHGCLINPPAAGTNSGKCYCSQSKVRRYINALHDQLRTAREWLKNDSES
jgi:hypothetical protein